MQKLIPLFFEVETDEGYEGETIYINVDEILAFSLARNLVSTNDGCGSLLTLTERLRTELINTYALFTGRHKRWFEVTATPSQITQLIKE